MMPVSTGAARKRTTYPLPLNVRNLIAFSSFLVSAASIFCIGWSYLFDRESSTYTHCEVDNFAPSISTAVGSFLPQKLVWQICIALQLGPRLLVVSLYRAVLSQRLAPGAGSGLLVKLHFGLALAENLALLGISVFTSSENFQIHKFCFGVFILSAFCYMSLSYYLFRYKVVRTALTGLDVTSLEVKKILLTVCLVAIPLLMYFYHRHNQYCEPYVYSFFCMTEYLIVASVIAFHGVGGYLDFDSTSFLFSDDGSWWDCSGSGSSSSSSYVPLKENA